MKITYDSEADALYIELRHVPALDSVDIEDGVTADLDADGHIIALEVLDASKRLTPSELSNVEYVDLGAPAARRRGAASRRVKAR